MKPGGRVAIVDVWRISQYRRIFRESRLENLWLSWPSFWFVVPSFILTAAKPPSDPKEGTELKVQTLWERLHALERDDG